MQFIGTACHSTNILDSKYCILQKLYSPPWQSTTSDILWRSVNGANVIWPGGQAPGYWLNALDGNWQVQGVGKFD